MSSKTRLYSIRTGIVAVIFALGFLCGTLNQRNADAGMGDLGGDLLQKAGGSGGTVGSVAQLGSTINDMEKNVSGLQKNLDTLKKVRSALGGR